MKAVIGRFYNNSEDALKEALRLTKMWNNRLQFYVLSYNNGNLVVGESQMEACGIKKPRYTKTNFKYKKKFVI